VTLEHVREHARGGVERERDREQGRDPRAQVLAAHRATVIEKAAL
jgi:hypothetical protein